MVDFKKQTLLIGVILAVYTVLLTAPTYLLMQGVLLHTGGVVGPATGLVIIFGVVFFLLLSVVSSPRKTIKRLEARLVDKNAELDDIVFNLEKTIEKRMFEISVVNASLSREIGERIQAEAQSKELQQRSELILNSAGEGIFGLDTEGRVTFVNNAAALMLGWQKEDLLGQLHHELVHHRHADGSPHDSSACPIRQAFLDGIVHFSSDDVFWTKEGTSFPVEYVSTPIIEGSVIKGAVVVFRDRSIYV